MADDLKDYPSDNDWYHEFQKHIEGRLARCSDVENGWSDTILQAIIDGRIPVDKTQFTSHGTKAVFPGKRITPYISIEQRKKNCRAEFVKAFGDSLTIILQMDPDQRKKLALTVRHLIIRNWFRIWPLPDVDDTEKLKLIHEELNIIGNDLRDMLFCRRIAIALAKSKKQPAPFKVFTRFDNWRSILFSNLNASRCHRWPTYTPPGPLAPPVVFDMNCPWDRHDFIIRVLGEIPRSIPSPKV